ncbi:MAG: hypothetical protein E6K65_00395 [Nitrospirae bacterium]|nr:MAG: hypothetical protein E6K66_08595 [Nitrospirota bacterium]TMQ31691.1 MAG: hypothetical protein E6K65_00395 [Nitrospirota bacterium]
MRLYSHRSPSVLARILFVFFFVLSFSAYACLMPVHGATHAAMENRCSTPDVQPVSQYCESFKMVGVQPADTRHLNRDWQTICSEDTASLALLVIHTSPSSRLSDHPTVGPPQDLLLKISVLRI